MFSGRTHPTIENDGDHFRRWVMEGKAEHPLRAQSEKLTTREAEIAGLIANGLSNKKIAVELDLAYSTVKNHVSSILRKLKLGNRTQIALQMRNSGYPSD